MSTVTGTSSSTAWFVNGERVYPCRCGKTHRGPYAHYDYGHHNCMHDSPLDDIGGEQFMCLDCGEVFDRRPDDA